MHGAEPHGGARNDYPLGTSPLVCVWRTELVLRDPETIASSHYLAVQVRKLWAAAAEDVYGKEALCGTAVVLATVLPTAMNRDACGSGSFASTLKLSPTQE